MIITIPANAVTNVSALLPTAPTDSNGVALKFANGEVSYYLNSGAFPDFYADAGWQRAKNNEIVRMAVGETVLWVMSTKDLNIDFEVVNLLFSGGGAIPIGAATEAKQDDQITELQAITAAIQDKKQVGYARVEDANGDEFNQVLTIDASVAPPVTVVYYFDEAGVAQSPVAPINVINTKQIASDMLSFKAIVATANYAIGDTLTTRTILTDGVKTGSFWTNETTDLPISAPPSTDYEQADDIVFIKAIGDPTDSLQTDETQDATLISLAKGTIATIKSNTIKTAAKGSTASGSPTSKNIDADTQAMHMVLAEAVKTNGVSASDLTPVAGSFSSIGQSAHFTPIAGRDFNIQVIFSGAVGQVNLERTFDGINFYPITGSGVGIMRFTNDANEQWGDSEVGVQYRLNCTALSAGTVTYRISQ
jgi:hypothetical protein